MCDAALKSGGRTPANARSPFAPLEASRVNSTGLSSQVQFGVIGVEKCRSGDEEGDAFCGKLYSLARLGRRDTFDCESLRRLVACRLRDFARLVASGRSGPRNFDSDSADPVRKSEFRIRN